MANAAAVHASRFRWGISNPFAPWSRMEAFFFLRFPSLMQWRVTILPSSRDGDTWNFWFYIGCSSLGDRDISVVDEIEVDIFLNGMATVHKNDWPNNLQNQYRYTYRFETSVIAPPMIREHHRLDVEIVISFRNVDIGNRVGNGLFYDPEDLSQLAEDLGELFKAATHSDMTVSPSDIPSRISVHSYILDARWDRFFTQHRRNNTSGVNVDISSDVLWDILTYVYSGQVRQIVNKLGIPAYKTELFQLIDRYSFHHLYRALVRDDLQQVRTTVRTRWTFLRHFSMDRGYTVFPPWHMNPNSNYGVVFRIRFFLQAGNPWFQYTIRSESNSKIHVQVNLEYTMDLSWAEFRSGTFHGRDYSIRPNAFVNSGRCVVEVPNFGLGAFRRCRPLKRKLLACIRRIRCLLFLSDGTSVVNVESENNIGLEDDRERFEVLSDHMYNLTVTRREADLRVICPFELPLDPEFRLDSYDLHKSIFTIRVPRWRRVIEGPPIEDDLPDEVRCGLPSEAFIDVARYIYTGKSFHIPSHFHDEVESFAELGGFEPLQRLVNRMRTAN